MARFNPLPPTELPNTSSQAPLRLRASGQLSNALNTGAKNVTNAARGAAAAGAAVLGQDDYARKKLGLIHDSQEVLSRSQNRVTTVSQVETFEDLTDFVVNTLGTNAPLFGALALGAPTALAARTGLGLAGAVTAKQAATAGIVGAGAGVETGSIFPEAVEADEKGRSLRELAGISIAGGTTAGVLEGLPVVNVLSKFGAGKAGSNFIKRALKDATEQGLLEAGTETAQTIIERATIKFVNENREIFTEEGIDEILTAAAGGAIFGGGIGGGASIANSALNFNSDPLADAMDDIEGEDELAITRASEQLKLMQDIPEAANIDPQDLDDPDVRELVHDLGVKHARGLGGIDTTAAFLRKRSDEAGGTTLTSSNINVIMDIAAGKVEPTEEVIDELRETFGQRDKVIKEADKRGLKDARRESFIRETEIDNVQDLLEEVNEDRIIQEEEAFNNLEYRETISQEDANARLQDSVASKFSADIRERFIFKNDRERIDGKGNQIKTGAIKLSTVKDRIAKLESQNKNAVYEPSTMADALKDRGLSRRVIKGIAKREAKDLIAKNPNNTKIQGLVKPFQGTKEPTFAQSMAVLENLHVIKVVSNPLEGIDPADVSLSEAEILGNEGDFGNFEEAIAVNPNGKRERGGNEFQVRVINTAEARVIGVGKPRNPNRVYNIKPSRLIRRMLNKLQVNKKTASDVDIAVAFLEGIVSLNQNGLKLRETDFNNIMGPKEIVFHRDGRPNMTFEEMQKIIATLPETFVRSQDEAIPKAIAALIRTRDAKSKYAGKGEISERFTYTNALSDFVKVDETTNPRIRDLFDEVSQLEENPDIEGSIDFLIDDFINNAEGSQELGSNQDSDTSDKGDAAAQLNFTTAGSLESKDLMKQVRQKQPLSDQGGTTGPANRESPMIKELEKRLEGLYNTLIDSPKSVKLPLSKKIQATKAELAKLRALNIETRNLNEKERAKKVRARNEQIRLKTEELGELEKELAHAIKTETVRYAVTEKEYQVRAKLIAEISEVIEALNKAKYGDTFQSAAIGLNSGESFELSVEEAEVTRRVNRSETFMVNKLSEKLGLEGLSVAALDEVINHPKAISAFVQGTRAFIENGKIYIDPRIQSKTLRQDLIGHEVGHALLSKEMKAMVDSTDTTLFEAMHESYLQWREAQLRNNDSVLVTFASKKTLEQTVNLMTDPLAQERIQNLSKSELAYLLDFQEWFADHMSRWTRENPVVKEPTDIVAKFFKGLKDILAEALKVAKSTLGFSPDVTVAAYIDDVISRNKKATLNADLTDKANSMPEELDQKLAAAAKIVTEKPFSEEAKEALRDVFMNELSPEHKKTMARFLGSRFTFKRLHNLLAEDKEAQFEITVDPYAAMAYAYQFHLAGTDITTGKSFLNTGPSTRTVFDYISEILEEVFGYVQDHHQAEKIFAAIASRQISKNYVVENRVRDTITKRAVQNIVDFTSQKMHPLMDTFGRTADARMRATNNPFFIQLANKFNIRSSNSAGVSETYFTARTRKIGFFTNKWASLVTGLDEFEKADLHEVLLDVNKFNALPKGDIVAQRARAAKNLFTEMSAYSKNKGVEVGFLKDYFPWVYDGKELAERSDEFKNLLLQDKFKAEIEAINLANAKVKLAKANKDLPKDEKLFLEDIGVDTPEEFVESIIDTLVNKDGYADVEINPDRNEFTPFMGSINKRVLSFVTDIGNAADQEMLTSFFSKDIDNVVHSYIRQVVKRSEFTERFGSEGLVIQDLLEAAEEFGATKEELTMAHHYVDAMIGKLGYSNNQRLMKFFSKIRNKRDDEGNLIYIEVAPGEVVNPTLQKIFSAAVVTQNFAVLSLATFTSLVDPIGIAVRGGSMDVAMTALKAGAKEITNAVQQLAGGDKKLYRSEMLKIAESLGVIEGHVLNEALEWEYGATWLTPGIKRANEFFFKSIGLTQLTKLTRVMAVSGGMQFLKRHGKMNNPLSVRYMEDLNLQEGDVITDATGGVKLLTSSERSDMARKKPEGYEEILAADERVKAAISRFVDTSILRPNAAQRPIWASDPHFILVFHLKSFMYAFHDNILRRAFSEALGHNNYGPVMFLALFAPMMMISDLFRDLFREAVGNPSGNPARSLGDRAMNSVQRSGLLGLGQIFADAGQDIRMGGAGIESFLGPTYQNGVTEFAEALTEGGNEWVDLMEKNEPYGNSTQPFSAVADFMAEE